MLPGLLLAISTNIMIPFGGPIFEEIRAWWLAPIMLGMWVFGWVGYCMPLMVNYVPFRPGTMSYAVLTRYGWAFDHFVFLCRCTMPACVEATCLMLWVAFVFRPKEPTLKVIVFTLVPVLMLTHFTWRVLQDRKVKSEVENGD
ncbi:MAG: hypothetical protein WBF17_20620 [Phycisphaerae bacterium]